MTGYLMRAGVLGIDADQIEHHGGPRFGIFRGLRGLQHRYFTWDPGPASRPTTPA
jgi:hypothetical protein